MAQFLTAMKLEFERYDPKEAPEDRLRALHDLNALIEKEYLPDEEPGPFVEMLNYKRCRAAHKGHIQWNTWDDNPNHLTGSAAFFFDRREENKHLGWFWIQVRQEERTKGIGNALLSKLIDEAKAENRTMLGGWAWRDGPGEKFLDKLGGTQRMLERQGRLWIRDVPIDLMNEWVDKAKERAGDYRLQFWDGPTPEELIERFAVAYEIMNTAPREDLDLQDEKVTPEVMRDREQTRVEQGNPWWTLAAIHEPTGEIAGFTEMYFSGYRDDIAWQGNTGVDPAHRNKGLGKWLKAAMFLKLIDEWPNITRIHTWNAGSNEPMLAINDAMGYHIPLWWTTWQAPTEVWEKAVKQRL